MARRNSRPGPIDVLADIVQRARSTLRPAAARWRSVSDADGRKGRGLPCIYCNTKPREPGISGGIGKGHSAYGRPWFSPSFPSNYDPEIADAVAITTGDHRLAVFQASADETLFFFPQPRRRQLSTFEASLTAASRLTPTNSLIGSGYFHNTVRPCIISPTAGHRESERFLVSMLTR